MQAPKPERNDETGSSDFAVRTSQTHTNAARLWEQEVILMKQMQKMRSQMLMLKRMSYPTVMSPLAIP